MLQAILAVTIPLILGGSVKKGDKGEGDVEYEVNNKFLGTILTVIRYIVMFSVYLGIAAVIWSVFAMEHPQGPQYTPPISVTMQCVINLTVQFFVVYLMLWIAQTAKDFLKWELTTLTQLMENA